MDLKPNQKIIFNNGITVTIHQTADGELVIDDQAFIEQMIKLGFRLGRNDSPERLAEIAKNVPPEYRQAFGDGVHDGK
jgi:hypothetical protein